MEALYLFKGGTSPDFNFSPMQLTAVDVDDLEGVVRIEEALRSDGFIVGDSDGSEFGDDLAFIDRARQALKAGYSVFYVARW